MGKVMSTVSKPLRNFNVENRAMKAMERQAKSVKPKAAPRHPSFSQQTRDDPELISAIQTKNEILHERLRNIRVESTGVAPEDSLISKPRALPQNKKKVEDQDFGYLIPDVIPEGRVSLKQVCEFITLHQQDPQGNSAEKIASEHKLELVHVQDMLNHFRSYNMYVPKKIRDKMTTATDEEIQLMARPPTGFVPSPEDFQKVEQETLKTSDTPQISR